MHFPGYILILPLHLLPKREHSEGFSHWGGTELKTPFLWNRFVPEWGWEKTQLHQWIIFYWEAHSLLWDPYWLRSSETWNPNHVTWADTDKSIYFVWHHCFHLLLNENIDIISNGVDGCCGKDYSQDFISFLNDAGERKVFTAVLSQWNECPGRPKVYSPCISQATFLFSHYICSWKENIQRTFRTEAAVDKKTASYEIGLFPSEVEEKTQLHQWIIFYWEAHSLLWDPYWLRSSETWNPTRNMGRCWQEYVFCVTPLLSSPTECEYS